MFTAVRPALNAAPESKRPETNWEEPEASTPTSPPCTWPVPATVNGRCCPSIPTPVDRSASNSGAIGRARACSSPSKTVGAWRSAATGGRNRSTVPASPQSTVEASSSPAPGETVRSVPSPTTSNPSERSAPIMRSVSRLRNAPETVEVPPSRAARAASTSARLV
ncbi:Uncharacterised protein [Mycobacteroides abscessus subsp. abscessus]|nr:Uncharacterised protein [Mycobacteroides abscessus subsp. abscessus]